MIKLPAIQLIKISDSSTELPENLNSSALEVSAKSEETLWEEFLRLQLKPRTREEYGKAIGYFCHFIAPTHEVTAFLVGFLQMPKRQAILLVLKWRQHLLDEGKAVATINLRLAALKSLVEYAGKQDACSYSLHEIKSLKSQNYKNTRGVPVDDYRSILALVDRTTDLGIRDYAILRLLWDLALRRGEVMSLDLCDYSPQDGRLMVLGKGQIDRLPIDLNHQLVEALDDWVAIRRGLYFQPRDGSDRDGALFLSCNGRRLAGTDVFRILRGYADAAGVRISPHRVRHSAITAFLDVSEGDMRSAQSLSRHKDPRTLAIYDDNRQGLQGKATKTLGDLLDF